MTELTGNFPAQWLPPQHAFGLFVFSGAYLSGTAMHGILPCALDGVRFWIFRDCPFAPLYLICPQSSNNFIPRNNWPKIKIWQVHQEISQFPCAITFLTTSVRLCCFGGAYPCGTTIHGILPWAPRGACVSYSNLSVALPRSVLWFSRSRWRMCLIIWFLAVICSSQRYCRTLGEFLA